MTRVAALDDPRRPRQADADLLSLALIDARNLTLAWLAAFEAAPAPAPGGRSPLWLAGHAGWYQEYWIARHVQRQRGPRCDASALRLASIEPAADDAFGPGGHGQALGYGVLRHYLAATLDLTLDLLASAAADDDALHFYRLALLHEDRLGEALAETAALWQLAAGGTNPAPWRPLAPRPARDPLWLPAQRITLGSAAGGLVPDNETGSLAVDLPEFEIDAQPVDWARYVEFAEDGGYDRRELWGDAGWAWAQATGRRAPRDVEQLRGAVLVQRQGQLQRAPLRQPVLHATRFEAEAWCRWAGRRLPTEAEWQVAASSAALRGFAWGDVFEWMAGSARAYPGWAPTPGTLDRVPALASQGVLRGASWMTRARQRLPSARRFAAPDSDTMFCGFRSCAF